MNYKKGLPNQDLNFLSLNNKMVYVMIFFCSIGLLKMVDRFYISLFKNGFFVLLHIYKDLLFIIRIIKMDRQKQVERKKQIQSKIRYIEGQKKNGRRTAELKQLKKELVEINSIVDYSSSSNSSRSSKRGSSSSSSSSSNGSSSSSSSISSGSSSSSIGSSSISSSSNSYINTANDDDDDFQDFFNNMEDPEVANLNKIQMLKNFYLFVIAKSKFLLFEIINNLY